MPQIHGSDREICWREVFPWLILVRAVRVSLMLRVLLTAWVGVLFTQMGWYLLESLFETDQPLPRIADVIYWEQLGVHGLMQAFAGWLWLSEPFVRCFHQDVTLGETLRLLASGVWAICVWALLGGVIARTAAVYLTQQRTLALRESWIAAINKWLDTLGGPLLGLLLVVGLALPLVVIGFLLRFPPFTLLAGFLWLFMLLWGIGLAVVVLALWLGWPLMWATLGVERSDAFDAASRTAAYVFQRPLHLIFYVAVAEVLGTAGQWLISGLTLFGRELTDWAVSWGAGAGWMTALPKSHPFQAWGTDAILFWKAALHSFASAYPLAYLWPASVGIYLLLRRQIDETQIEELGNGPGPL
jgi:hypothetical protein